MVQIFASLCRSLLDTFNTLQFELIAQIGSQRSFRHDEVFIIARREEVTDEQWAIWSRSFRLPYAGQMDVAGQ